MLISLSHDREAEESNSLLIRSFLVWEMSLSSLFSQQITRNSVIASQPKSGVCLLLVFVHSFAFGRNILLVQFIVVSSVSFSLTAFFASFSIECIFAFYFHFALHDTHQLAILFVRSFSPCAHYAEVHRVVHAIIIKLPHRSVTLFVIHTMKCMPISMRCEWNETNERVNPKCNEMATTPSPFGSICLDLCAMHGNRCDAIQSSPTRNASFHCRCRWSIRCSTESKISTRKSDSTLKCTYIATFRLSSISFQL